MVLGRVDGNLISAISDGLFDAIGCLHDGKKDP